MGNRTDDRKNDHDCAVRLMANEQKFWLVKTEPTCFSVQDLAKQPKQTTCWSGVRNYQARNFMRDEMQLGDRVLVYHSSTDEPADCRYRPGRARGISRSHRLGQKGRTL